MQIRLGPDDYEPLEQFRLRWRWDKDRSDISESERLRIRALREPAAMTVWRLMRVLGSAIPECCGPSGLPCVREHSTPYAPAGTPLRVLSVIRAAGTHDEVLARLLALPVDTDEPVVVSWD